MATLVQREVFEVISETSGHAPVEVYCDDGELWIRQGKDTISVARSGARLLAQAITSLTGGQS